MEGFDPEMTAKMMEQFFAMEQHFRTAAESQQYGSPFGAASTQSPYMPIAPNAIQVHQPGLAAIPPHITMKKSASASRIQPPHQQQYQSPQISAHNGSSHHPGAMDVSAESSPFVGSANTGDYDEEEEEEEGDWSLTMGEELESVEEGPKSMAKRRRERRARRDKMFKVMKRGRFYEIQEMLEEQQARLAQAQANANASK